MIINPTKPPRRIINTTFSKEYTGIYSVSQKISPTFHPEEWSFNKQDADSLYFDIYDLQKLPDPVGTTFGLIYDNIKLTPVFNNYSPDILGQNDVAAQQLHYSYTQSYYKDDGTTISLVTSSPSIYDVRIDNPQIVWTKNVPYVDRGGMVSIGNGIKILHGVVFNFNNGATLSNSLLTIGSRMVHGDDNDSNAKNTATFTFYLDHEQLKDILIAERAEKTTVNVYHLDGSAWV